MHQPGDGPGRPIERAPDDLSRPHVPRRTGSSTTSNWSPSSPPDGAARGRCPDDRR
jgi:hypothetical protein